MANAGTINVSICKGALVKRSSKVTGRRDKTTFKWAAVILLQTKAEQLAGTHKEGRANPEASGNRELVLAFDIYRLG